MTASRFPALVLFDLDGTLLDSAPDMLAAGNVLRAEHGTGPMRLDALRPHVSKGARAMLAAAFPGFDAGQRDALIPQFLAQYERELARHGTPFDGVEALLLAIEADGGRWGIVTNKPEYLAKKLLPLLHAAQALQVEPWDCAYVGDDERDIVAARSADMPSVVALWGYRLADDAPEAWGGDVMVETPHALLDPAIWPRRARGGRDE
jgi:phosphoglycolate phosphatase